DRLTLLNLATPEQLQQLETNAREINQHLKTVFDECGVILVDFKLEFGLDAQNQLYLADEISPDTCRLWDKTETDPQKRVLDKDRFRQDLGQVEAAYQSIQERVLNWISRFS
ncbi:MAG: phosphoribosylaminoimidazolesuccinocarboxamide synthase, partial [Kamptonema sp. SIO4C4]|nr:phosphoribosylaminoimidazolesuccinocarboxamide synthase [Kamptonema sp. SIO4C4]